MSDQYTRITCGGSPFSPTAPVVGLLLGTFADGALQIYDSDDIPVAVEHKEAAERQVSLHHAVFPQHEVLGWYRVSSTDDQPTADDLALMVELKQRYQPEEQLPFVFSLLQAPCEGKKSDDEDKDLPFTLFQLSSNQKSLVALEDWTLETSESERIGLEHVVRYQPQRRRRDTKQKEGEPQDSAYCDTAKDIQHSLEMIQSRLTVVETFLVDTQSQKIPLHPQLLRQVQGLVWQLGPLKAGSAATPTPPATDMVQQVALLARTVEAIQSYSDKFAAVQDRRPAREGRRGILDP